MKTIHHSWSFGWTGGIILIVVTIVIMLFFSQVQGIQSVTPTFTNALGLQQYVQRVEKFTFCSFQSIGKIPKASCK